MQWEVLCVERENVGGANLVISTTSWLELPNNAGWLIRYKREGCLALLTHAPKPVGATVSQGNRY